jgi:hypothetical protein
MEVTLVRSNMHFVGKVHNRVYFENDIINYEILGIQQCIVIVFIDFEKSHISIMRKNILWQL